jgi:lipopolysaccharide transport system permease protein
VVIRPPGRWPGLALGELWRNRRIGLVLAKRNFKVRYRQTALGVLWAVIQPLLLMVVFTVFFGLIGRMPRQGDVPFPVFFLAGIAIWHAAARLLSQATVSIIQNSSLIEKVYFPRIYFPVSAALVSLVDLGFAVGALVVLLAIFGIVPGWEVLLAPFFAAVGFTTVLGVGMWLSALNARYRDVGQILPFVTQLWFFSSPILYPASFVPEPFYTLYFVNPMAFAITGFRWAFAGLQPPPVEAWVIAPLVAAFVLISGYVFFRLHEPTLDDVL